MFVLAMMPVQGGNTVRNSPSRQQCCCILLSTQAFAQVSRLVGKLAVGRNLQLRFGSALKHHRLNIAGSSRGFPQEQRQVTFDSTGALYFEGLKQVPDPRSAVLCSNPRLETTVPRQNRANSVSWRLPILRAEFLRSCSPDTWHSWPGLDRGAARCPAGFEFRQADKNSRKDRFSVARGCDRYFELSQF
jgi:hypothetical protein